MKRIILSLLTLVFFSPPLVAAKQDVDSVLFAYYTRCTENIDRQEVLQTADTLFELSVKKNDVRMQAAALALKADHYYATNNLDSLKAWLPRIYAFTKANDQIRYYYFVWNRVITYYIKASQFTYAQYELEKMLLQAEKDQHKESVAQAYSQLGNIFATKRLDSLALTYYTKAIDYTKAHNINNFGLSTAYIRQCRTLLAIRQYDKAREAIDQAEKNIAIPDQIWDVKKARATLFVHLKEYDKALSLLQDIERNGVGKLDPAEIYNLQYTVYRALRQYDKSLEAINNQIEAYKALGYNERYYSHNLRLRAEHYALKDDYRQAYEELVQYTRIYEDKIQEEGTREFNEFATLFNVDRLNQEKIELEQIAQEERHHRYRQLIIGQSILLLLTIIFVFLLVRFNSRLRQAKLEAESASRMKSLFIQHITHELNTPLNAIVGFSELAAVETDPAARTEYIEIIHTNCEQLQKLVENVICVSDLESSEQLSLQASVAINDCCKRSMERTRADVKQSVELRFHPGCEELTIQSNPVYVQQILTNLLHNASRFTVKGWIELAYTYDKSQRILTFSITDTGCGIPAAESERIFERFAKLNSFSPGFGLGLTVCREAAHRLGGEVRLDTTFTEEGSRFIFTLPANGETYKS